MIVRVYFDCDMRMGVDGLTNMLKEKRVAVSSIKEADFVLFLNKAKTHFKMLAGSGYMVHFKSKQRLTLEDIEKVPKIFGTRKELLKGKNLEKVNELLGEDMKVYEAGELKVV